MEGLVRAPGQSELVLDMGDLGQLRYNQSFAFLRAHCPKHGRACLRQRTVLASSSSGQQRQGQGRPIGLLLDWLLKADQYDDAQSHKKMGVGTFDDRVAARARVHEHEGHESFLQVERPQNEDEDEEPRRIPWFLVFLHVSTPGKCQWQCLILAALVNVSCWKVAGGPVVGGQFESEEVAVYECFFL